MPNNVPARPPLWAAYMLSAKRLTLCCPGHVVRVIGAHKCAITSPAPPIIHPKTPLLTKSVHAYIHCLRLPLVEIRSSHGSRGMNASTIVTASGKPQLLDRVRHAVRQRHMARSTEKTYVYWCRRYILYHNRRHPLDMGKREIEGRVALLSHKLASPSVVCACGPDRPQGVITVCHCLLVSSERRNSVSYFRTHCTTSQRSHQASSD